MRQAVGETALVYVAVTMFLWLSGEGDLSEELARESSDRI